MYMCSTINDKTKTNESFVLIYIIFVDDIQFHFPGEKHREKLYQIQMFKKINEKNISMRFPLRNEHMK